MYVTNMRIKFIAFYAFRKFTYRPLLNISEYAVIDYAIMQ